MAYKFFNKKSYSNDVKSEYSLLCFIDIYSIYAQVVRLKDKNYKKITITNAFQKNFQMNLISKKKKKKKKCNDKGNEFYNLPMKSRLQDNDVDI